MPGEPHETVKERIGALLELYLLMAGFDFTPTGSMTLESETGKVKREAMNLINLLLVVGYPIWRSRSCFPVVASTNWRHTSG
jgi:hypothetical protein